jgi:hypothetical protein
MLNWITYDGTNATLPIPGVPVWLEKQTSFPKGAPPITIQEVVSLNKDDGIWDAFVGRWSLDPGDRWYPVPTPEQISKGS